MRTSRLWNELEDKAAEIFVNSRQEKYDPTILRFALLIDQNSPSVRPSFATLVTSAISRASEDIQFSDKNEDSDEWLNVDASSFEDMLQRTSGSDAKTKDSDGMDVDETPEDRSASKQASQLRELALKAAELIEGEGHANGARIDE